jgi:hypothetical protein
VLLAISRQPSNKPLMADGCFQLQNYPISQLLNSCFFLGSPQAQPHLHNIYTAALLFALAQSPLSGAQSREGP